MEVSKLAHLLIPRPPFGFTNTLSDFLTMGRELHDGLHLRSSGYFVAHPLENTNMVKK
jgi:hypothetical protein